MICGVDEAGRGPVIGPMVVAGVKVQDDGKLIDMKVKDSKRLSAKRREELEEKIKKSCEFTVRVVSAEDIDSLRDSMTLNALEANLFANIIEELCGENDSCYVDSASTDERKFKEMVHKGLNSPVNITSEHGADDEYPVVSAASILAKVERDRRVKEISKELGKDIGSGYPSDRKTRDFLQNWISEKGSLPPHTRKSWETARELMNRFKNRSLDEF
ncbi:MAG: ribonuclease HII [Candidatus Aenigmatarchaeota archaeon]